MKRFITLCFILIGCSTTKPTTQPADEKQTVYIKSMIVDKKVVHYMSIDGKNFKIIGETPVTGTTTDTSYSSIKPVKVIKP